MAFVCLASVSVGAQQKVPTSRGEPVSGDIPEWQARLELAELLVGGDRLKEAEAEYRKVLAERPDTPEAVQGLARVLAWTGRNDEAARLFAKLPGGRITADDRMLLADHHIGRREYPKAVEQLDAILAENPDADGARLKLAEVYSWDGKLDQSIDQYQRLLKRRPEDIQVRRKYAQVLSWAGRNEDAIQELRRTLD
jgi:thioredoxin-like negative regulator of GroEL